MTHDSYYIYNGYLFKRNIPCIPKCSLKELLIREVHKGGLTGHFGEHKILGMLHEHIY